MAIHASILIPAHNRRELTLHCLENLASQGVADWAAICVIDDGSVDGTSDAIKSRFPNTTILSGSGNLWWGGAMELGMRHAAESDAMVIFWLNDDCLPATGTLEILRNACLASRGVAAGQSVTPSGFIYGGHRKSAFGFHRVIASPQEILRCDAASGNCVAIHRSVVGRIGFPDGRRFPHNFADLDYLLRATKSEIVLEVFGSAHCRNSDNLSWESPFLSDKSLRHRLSMLGELRTAYHFQTQVNLCYAHWGLACGTVQLAFTYGKFAAGALVSAILPLRWRRALFGRYSRAERVRAFHAAPESSRAAVK